MENRTNSNIDNNFYNNIEEPIREAVKMLRNRGVNTICSCGHEMWIAVALGNHMDEVEAIANILAEEGYENFRIECTLRKPSDGFWDRRATIYLNQWM